MLPVNSSTAPQDLGLEEAFGSLTMNGYSNNGIQTPRTPSFPPLHFPGPSTPQPHILGNTYGTDGSASLDSFTGGNIHPYHSWSPPFSSYPQLTLQPPRWSALSPGTIGQERGSPLHQRSHLDYCSPHQRGPSSMVVRRCFDNSSGHHNVVDIARISQGTDVRTTVSLPVLLMENC